MYTARKGVKGFSILSQDLPVVLFIRRLCGGLAGLSAYEGLTPTSLIKSAMTSCTAKKATGALGSFTTLNRREAMPELISHCFLNRKFPLFIDRATVAQKTSLREISNTLRNGLSLTP